MQTRFLKPLKHIIELSPRTEMNYVPDKRVIWHSSWSPRKLGVDGRKLSIHKKFWPMFDGVTPVKCRIRETKGNRQLWKVYANPNNPDEYNSFTVYDEWFMDGDLTNILPDNLFDF